MARAEPQSAPRIMKELLTALAKAKRSFDKISKDKTAKIKTKAGAEFSYKYAALDTIIEATEPTLSENGLIVIHRVVFEEGSKLESTIWHVSGESLPPSYFPLAAADDPKTFAANITYGKRYNTCCLLDLAIEEDNDAQRLPEKIRPTEPLQVTPLTQSFRGGTITEPQRKRLHALRAQWKVSETDLKIIIANVQNCAVEEASTKTLTQSQYDEACAMVEDLGRQQQEEAESA